MLPPDLAMTVTSATDSVTKALTVFQVDQETIDEVVKVLQDAASSVRPQRFRGDAEVDAVGFGDTEQAHSLAQAYGAACVATYESLTKVLEDLDAFCTGVLQAGKLFTEVDELTTADLAGVNAGVETMLAAAHGERRWAERNDG
jgi:hypothetical protein